MNQSTKSSKVKVTIFLTTTNVRMMFNKEETYTVFRPNIFLEQSFVIQMSERMKIEKYFTSITWDYSCLKWATSSEYQLV